METWQSWKIQFFSLRAPNTYLSIANWLFLSNAVFRLRFEIWYKFLPMLAISLIAFGVLIDQVAHLLWFNGFKGHKSMTLKAYTRLIPREHDNLGLIPCITLVLYLGNYYLLDLPVIIANILLMVRIRFYH